MINYIPIYLQQFHLYMKPQSLDGEVSNRGIHFILFHQL